MIAAVSTTLIGWNIGMFTTDGTWLCFALIGKFMEGCIMEVSVSIKELGNLTTKKSQKHLFP
jgi:hypothetical protein